jgi:hypothetical protein
MVMDIVDELKYVGKKVLLGLQLIALSQFFHRRVFIHVDDGN